MKELMAAARLMVLVTHEIPTLELICNKAIWMEHGSMKMVGEPADVVAAYKGSVTSPQATTHVGAGVGTDETVASKAAA
jgi:ABC-type polysaccharide/polyol phosphate transport system ATPase subunit